PTQRHSAGELLAARELLWEGQPAGHPSRRVGRRAGASAVPERHADPDGAEGRAGQAEVREDPDQRRDRQWKRRAQADREHGSDRSEEISSPRSTSYKPPFERRASSSQNGDRQVPLTRALEPRDVTRLPAT